MISYFNSRFLPKEEIAISPDDRGFLFGDGVYEVIRSYSGKLFKTDEHLQRLERSLREIRIAGIDVAHLGDVANELLVRNDLRTGDATIYIQVTRGVAPRKHSFPDAATPPTVYATASPLSPSAQKAETGVKIILVPDIRWARCDIKSIALLPNVLANQQAKERGAEEAVFVRDGTITEGSHSNFCAVFDGTLVTHPKSDRILAGVTRQVVLDLCREISIPVREIPVREKELPRADELMLLGTTTGVMPIVRVDERQIGDGKPGPVTRRLLAALRELTRGA
jgi:D-alanine transaminase